MAQKICIITGKRNGGKTTTAEKLVEEYHSQGKNVGGIISRGIIQHRQKTGYSAVDISSGEEKVLISLDKIESGFKFKRFFFSQDGFEFAEHQLKKNIDLDVLVIDEVGQLELEGKGFYSITLYLMENFDGILILVIRDKFLDKILDLLKINKNDVEILYPQNIQE